MGAAPERERRHFPPPGPAAANPAAAWENAAMSTPPLPTLESPRLRLRPYRQDDARAIYALYSDPVVTRYWSFPAWTRREQASDYLAARMALETPAVYAWAMAEREGAADALLLSPRSAERSERLADEFAQCERLDSNQAVIDASEIVVLGMRPQQVDEALADLRFRSDQVVASLIAGTPPSGIAPLVTPATRVCQLIPLPAISLRRGPLVISPPLPEVEPMLDALRAQAAASPASSGAATCTWSWWRPTCCARWRRSPTASSW